MKMRMKQRMFYPMRRNNMLQEKIISEKAPKAIGPYSAGISVGDYVFLSGQLGIIPETGKFAEGIEAQTTQAIDNIEALLKESGLDLRYVVKTTVYLADMNDFAKVNEIYGKRFSDPYPARSCVEVSCLPKNGLVEIEVFAIDTRALEVICSEEGDACCCGSCCHE